LALKVTEPQKRISPEDSRSALAGTCQLFESKNNSVLNDWAGVEAENWPA